MCFSSRVSLVTGVVCWLCALYIYIQTPQLKGEALFLATYSSIQFADAILHSFPDENAINWATTSILVPFILCLQIAVHMKFRNETDNLLPLLPAFAYIFWKFRGYSKPSCNRWKSPVWGGKEITLPEFVIFSLLILYPRWNLLLLNWAYMAVVVHFVKGGYGSMWCSLACMFAVGFVAQSVKLQRGD